MQADKQTQPPTHTHTHALRPSCFSIVDSVVTRLRAWVILLFNSGPLYARSASGTTLPLAPGSLRGSLRLGGLARQRTARPSRVGRRASGPPLREGGR